MDVAIPKNYALKRRNKGVKKEREEGFYIGAGQREMGEPLYLP
ncbi:uncharacterized protein G2W53_026552 [Senna tora]|uniref:Uncharacterized protein n=1 Tax=Senna tora TaxID=362788 RepID=A0A834TFA7_9FABA|nr:uncharacterized protein G2W53_026552 [Senna tora]